MSGICSALYDKTSVTQIFPSVFAFIPKIHIIHPHNELGFVFFIFFLFFVIVFLMKVSLAWLSKYCDISDILSEK